MSMHIKANRIITSLTNFFASRNRGISGRKPKSKYLLTGLLVGFIVLVCFALVSAFISVHKWDNPDPAAHVVMVLDLTDGLSDEQYRALLDEFEHLRNGLKVGERFSLYAIQDGELAGTRAVKLFSKRRPRDGSQANIKNSNPKRIKQRFRKEFQDPLQHALEGLDYTQEAATTPILETLRTVARTPDFAGAKTRKLVLFSNMLENSNWISHYRKHESIARLQERSLRVFDVQGILSEAKVIVFQIPEKNSDLQNAAHLQWWRDYFEYAEAASFELKRL